MNTTLINGFQGDRNAIQDRERILRAFNGTNPQVFRQLVKFIRGESCAKIATNKLAEVGLLKLDELGQPVLASIDPIDVAIIQSAVTISDNGGALTFGAPYRPKAGKRRHAPGQASIVTTAAQMRQPEAASA